jgi:hypothetical protein
VFAPLRPVPVKALTPIKNPGMSRLYIMPSFRSIDSKKSSADGFSIVGLLELDDEVLRPNWCTKYPARIRLADPLNVYCTYTSFIENLPYPNPRSILASQGP